MKTFTDPIQISHARFLPLLISYLKTDRDYSADSGHWSQALQNLRDKYEDEYPGLFDDIGFSTRIGRRPYSREVSQFLTELSVGAVVQVMNPGYLKLRINPDAQSEVREHHEERVGDSSIIEAIKRMAGELERSELLEVT